MMLPSNLHAFVQSEAVGYAFGDGYGALSVAFFLDNGFVAHFWSCKYAVCECESGE